MEERIRALDVQGIGVASQVKAGKLCMSIILLQRRLYSMVNKRFNYEILCIDSDSSSNIKTAEQFIHSLLANDKLWQTPKADIKKKRIIDSKVSVNISSISPKGALDFAPQNSFHISIKGDFDYLENMRLLIITHIEKQDIPTIYVITDEISEHIAQQVYPKINKVENRLRSYLIKFFATKLGSNWWKLTADTQMEHKVKQRKYNETVFADHIDNQVYLIDFNELGKIVYVQSSGFINREDVVKKVMSLEEDAAAVKRLKEELQSNYTKYFKSTFKDKGFQQKWEALEKIRHKVAHNNLFTKEDLSNAIELSQDLISIIEEADRKVDEVVFSKDEQGVIQEAIIESLDLTEGKEAITWRAEVQNTLKALGGEADLSQIYDHVAVHHTRDLSSSWKESIRWTLQINSSDSTVFSGKNDVFRRVSKGRWALRYP